MGLEIAIVPVALVPSAAGFFEFKAFRPSGAYLTTPADPTRTPRSVAAALLRDNGPNVLRLIADKAEPDSGSVLDADVEAVGIVELDDGSTTALVFSAPLPMSAALVDADYRAVLDAPAPDWTGLAPVVDDLPPVEVTNETSAERAESALRTLDPIRRATLEHWYRQLAETTAVFELLPRFFTLPQARSAYAALWRDELDAGNFHKWLRSDNDGVLSAAHGTLTHPVEQIIQSEKQAVTDRLWPRITHDERISPVDMDSLAPRGMTGTSPWAIGEAAKLTIPAVLSAVAAGLVAFENAPPRGRRPLWFHCDVMERRLLRAAYPRRPLWRPEGMRSAPIG